MSILDRLNTLVRSNLQRSGGQQRESAMTEMRQSIREARKQAAELRVGERRLIEEIRQAQREADRWEERAVIALERGEEDLAREALRLRATSDRDARRLRESLDVQRAYMRDIYAALEALQVKLDGTRSRLEAERRRLPTDAGPLQRPLEASEREDSWEQELHRRIQAREADGDSDRLADSDRNPRFSRRSGAAFEDESHFDTGETFSEFDRMASKIERVEADLEAHYALSVDELADPRRAELERIFERLERKKSDTDDLADLKKKFQ